MDVVVVGSANLDVVLEVEALPQPGGTSLARARREGAGGKGLNQAVAAARAEASTALLACTGQDPAREVLLRELRAGGVEVGLVRAGIIATGTAFVFVDRQGENTIVVDPGANARLTGLSSQERSVVREAAVVLCQLEVPVETVIEAFVAARGLAVLNAAPVQALPERLLEQVGVLVVNEHEARQLSGRADPDAALPALLGLVPEVVITLGEHGALAGARGTEAVHVVGGSPQRVLDTTGAGDTFCGVYAASRARGADSVTATRSAVLAATLSVERPGAASSAPTLAEVRERWPEG